MEIGSAKGDVWGEEDGDRQVEGQVFRGEAGRRLGLGREPNFFSSSFSGSLLSTPPPIFFFAIAHIIFLPMRCEIS